MVPSGADEDEDLPLLEEDLVPPLLRGLLQRRFAWTLMRYWGERATKVEMWRLEGLRSRAKKHVWGSRNICVGELVPRLSIRHDDGTMHVKQDFKWIGDTVVHAVNKSVKTGTCQSPGFGGLGLVPLGEGGVLPLLPHRSHIEHRLKRSRNLVPDPQNFLHLPLGGLAVLREKNIAVDCVAEAVHEVTSHQGGWAVSHHGGVGGGIRGGVLQRCPAQGGLGRNEGGEGPRFPIPNEPLHHMESGQSDIGDVVEGGHGRVAGQDAQIVPALGLHCLRFKRKVRLFSLRHTGRKVVMDGNHVHPL